MPSPPTETLGEELADALAYEKRLVDGGLVQPDCRAFVTSAPKPRGACLLLHGFTAGPWQFEELATLLTRRGLQCYAPRLSGHGFRTANGDASPHLLPTANGWESYLLSASTALERTNGMARRLDVCLFVFGFSAGGTLALHLGQQHPTQIARCVAVAPLLQPRAPLVRSAYLAARASRAHGVVGVVLDRVATGWGAEGRAEAASRGRAGHWDFQLGHAFAVLRVAEQVREAPQPLLVPTRFVINEADPVVQRAAIERFVRRQGGTGRHEITRLPARLCAPHAYLSPRELVDAPKRQALQQMCASSLMP